MSDTLDSHLGGPGGPLTSSCATELVCRDCGYRAPLARHRLQVPRLRRGPRHRLRLRARQGADLRARARRAAEQHLALRGAAADHLAPGPAAGRPVRRPDAADPRRPARRRDRAPQPLPQGRLDQPPDPLLQGPGGGDGDRPPARARQGRGRLRLDRQRRHRGRGAGGEGRGQRLHLLPRQHGEGEGESLPRARRPGLSARRQLRPGQPRLPRALAGERDRVRQHHPAPVLRRGGEDDGLRGRRAARLGRARPLRDPGRRGNALLARPQGAERAGDGRPGRDRRRPRSTSPRPSGCGPIATAILGGGEIEPQTPETAAHSLAIGAPGDGALVLDAVRTRGGSAATASIRRSSRRSTCSARTEGILTEPAGGTTIASTAQARGRGQDRRRRRRRRGDQRQRLEDAARSTRRSPGRKWSPATSRRWARCSASSARRPRRRRTERAREGAPGAQPSLPQVEGVTHRTVQARGAGLPRRRSRARARTSSSACTAGRSTGTSGAT